MFNIKFCFVLLALAVTVIAPVLGMAANNSKARETIIISDMSKCQPAYALSKVREKHRWQLIPYKGEGLDGVILGAASLIGAPDVTLPLEVSGWYAIHIGFWNPHYASDGSFRLKLRLTGDACFQNISDPEPSLQWPGWVELKETFFKYADLTGQDLIIGQHSKGYFYKAYLGYVKLVPLSDKEVAAIKKDRARKDTRMLYALSDGGGAMVKSTTREDLMEEVEAFRYSDVKAFVFAATFGDLVQYPSKIGTPLLSEAGDAVGTPIYKSLRDGLRTLLDKGIVPIRVLSEHCHQVGIEFHAMFRLAILGQIPPSVLWENSKGIVRRRPDLRMVDKDGAAIEKASYAYPEVRDYMLSMIREVAEGYDIDGVHLCFLRGPQFVGYEDIVIKDFKAKYGIDPRELDENDIRAQRQRASYLTEFVRSARKLVNEVGQKKGKKIELSAMTYPATVNGREWNLFFGFDFPTWFEEELLDNIFMYLFGPPSPNVPDPNIVEMAHSHNCKFIANIGGNPSQAVKLAQDNFKAEVDGFSVWDFDDARENPEYWQVYRRIGHKEEVDAFVNSMPKIKTTRLKTVGGFDVNHITNKGAKEHGFTGPPEMLPFYSGG